MKNTKIPLDQIAINDNDEVTTVYKAQPEDETLHPFPNVKYILEVNQNSGIEEGDDFEFDESDDPNKYVMKVLAPDGSTQMNLQGGIIKIYLLNIVRDQVRECLRKSMHKTIENLNM